MVHQPPAEELPEQPHTYLYDPGNGPRVRDTRAFLSSYFAHPPSLSDPLCAEFAQEEVLQMLTTVLPEETALVSLIVLVSHRLFLTIEKSPDPVV
jgi:hypothetical protein